MTAEASIDVVVVNWNSGDSLRVCVASLQEHGKGLIGRIVVVDNGSEDGSTEGLDSTIDCVVLRPGKNLGFAKACNLGAKECSSEFILFMNPDARTTRETFPAVTPWLLHWPKDLGILGVQQRRDDGEIMRTCARFPTSGSFLLHTLGIDRLVPRLGYAMLDWPHHESGFVDHVMGSFLLMRRIIWESSGGFDQRFFLYMEDLDLSRRVAASGLRIYFESAGYIVHEGGGCSRKIKGRRIGYDMSSRITYARIHMGVVGGWLQGFAILFIEPVVRVLVGVFKCDMQGVAQSVSGMWYAWRLRIASLRSGE